MALKNKVVPVIWLMLAATVALIVVNVLGLPWASWWMVPYPTFLYLAFIALYMLHGTKLVNFALKAFNSKQK
jgi:hypothetical protein